MLNFLPGFGAFAVAGLIAASAPILIHLLNRRRFRVKEWAAMDFLLEAVRRRRRFMHLRDILLLILRTAALALFGLALARPFFSSTATNLVPNQPIHAVVVVDNSLSMGYQKLDNSVLLDESKQRVREFINDLPEGSIISLIPVCGSPAGFSRDAYRTKQDARDALEQIQVADRSASAAQMIDLAADACQRHPDVSTKRVVLVGDQQRINWPAGVLADQLRQLPDVQIVSVTPDEVENSWIADFRIQDGLADLDSPALFTAVVRHEGAPRRAVEVKLSINGSEVDSKIIDLEPGQAREVTFSYRFDIPVEEGRPTWVPAQVSIPHDHHRTDDARFLMVPVMSAVPVVFIDQYGRDENPSKNRIGETRALRRLLAASGEAAARQLLSIRHLKVEQLDRKTLEGARLVVMAGVADPGPAVPLLRDFVRQGGQLVLAAGGDFDPIAWTRTAWLDGAGILPAPLAEQPIGQTPEEAKGELRPFFLSFPSMAHDYFHLADTPRDQLEDLYRRPFFFKAVSADVSPAVLQTIHKTDVAQIEEERAKLADSAAKYKKWSELESRGKLSDADRQDRDKEDKKVSQLRPSWLLWKPQEPVTADASVKPGELADRWRPHVLATYDNNQPFMIQRSLGQGQIVFVTTGIFSSWNTLPRENAVLLFSRVLRSMLEGTLPPRNLSTVDPLTLSVTDRHAIYQLTRPDGTRESLTVDALGSDQFGVNIPPQATRGIYRMTATRVEGAGNERTLDVPFAVNGPEQESEPALLNEPALRDRLSGANFRWVGRGEAIRLEGGQVSGHGMWKWLLLAVLGFLLLEMTVLAWPMLGKERAE